MSPRPPDDLNDIVGSRVGDDRFEIILYRGSGRRGHVYKAIMDDSRERALKFVPIGKLRHCWDQECVKAHQLEDQPNTVRFHDLFLYKQVYAVMVFDWVEGVDLKEKILKRELSIGDVWHILENLIFFRRDCLSKNQRHGDLHPGNIILHKPKMGRPREYEVKITDFGIGYTGAVLEPKDDNVQIGLIASEMLQSITREHLSREDRIMYSELCSGGALKKLRERSPVEWGNEKVLLNDVLQELSECQKRTSASQVKLPQSTRFGDYLAGEQLGDRWEEWQELFVPNFPGYEDIVSRNNTVLTGTRGCGKTVVFRRLSKLLSFRVSPVDEKAAGALVGVYLNMNDIADAFAFSRKQLLTEDFAMRVIQFFHLSLLGEIARIAAVAREKAEPASCQVHDSANRWLFEFVTDLIANGQLYFGPGSEMGAIITLIEEAKDEVRISEKPIGNLNELAQLDWLKRFVPKLQSKMPWIGNNPLFFFLDDYSLPRVDNNVQKVLNSAIFQRSDSFFFKVSTESPSTLFREDYSGKTLDEPHDFELTDLGSVTIDLPDKERESFLDEVFRRRLEREHRFKGKTLGDMLGCFGKSWAALAREIRRELSDEKEGSPLEKTPHSGVLYHGRDIFVNMWSGDTRQMVKIAQNILDQLPKVEDPKLPISRKLQDKVFRNTGGEFLHLLKVCTRTDRGSPISLPPNIRSWGEHLVKVAEAFKEVALYELRNREGGRKDRNEPKQAFRVEIVDEFDLDGIEKELYEDLVRYGVFLRDDRGKSIRGAIIPRLYLRRLLIPYCTLTFSKIDNIAVKASDFRKLLLKPSDFAVAWKKNRRDFDVDQMKLFE
jgi:serine/threonine protein kinase